MNHLRLVSTPSHDVSHDEACLGSFQKELEYIFYSLRRLGVPAFELDDMAQDVFLALRKAWGNYDPSRPLRPYLFGIAFRVVSVNRRKHQREVLREFVDTVDESGSPYEALQNKQALSLLLAALEKVPLPRRAVLVMHDLDETPAAEIAVALGIPLFTVYSRLRKGRVELGAALRRLARQGEGG